MRINLSFQDVLREVREDFVANKLGWVLMCLGVAVGSASLILIFTIILTGRKFILGRIQAIGNNLVYVANASSEQARSGAPTGLTDADLQAVRSSVPGIVASAPMMQNQLRLSLPNTSARVVNVLGVTPEYKIVRNLAVLRGTFFEEQDIRSRAKVALVTPRLGEVLFGDRNDWVGSSLRLEGVRFLVVGVFVERVQTFGQSEVGAWTVLVPYSCAAALAGRDEHSADELFFSLSSYNTVRSAEEQIRRVLTTRHGSATSFNVQDLSNLMEVTRRIANALAIALTLLATVALATASIGIMNTMLANVYARMPEVGLRRALGATRRDIRAHFMAEAALISLIGASVGMFAGIVVPALIGWALVIEVPFSVPAILLAFAVSAAIGTAAGLWPANKAANMTPTRALAFEE